VLAFVLGSLLESSARRSLIVFDGDLAGFATRPISGVLFAVLIAVLLLPLIGWLRRRRRGQDTAAPAPPPGSDTDPDGRTVPMNGRVEVGADRRPREHLDDPTSQEKKP
jgi:putative tricarboxylic transport membrane protein